MENVYNQDGKYLGIRLQTNCRACGDWVSVAVPAKYVEGDYVHARVRCPECEKRFDYPIGILMGRESPVVSVEIELSLPALGKFISNLVKPADWADDRHQY